ncbi:MAG: hypothetical protein AABY64_10635 [Bdellovibrionota bacterium]
MFMFLMNSELNRHGRNIASEEIDEIPLEVEFDLTNFEGVTLNKRIKYRLFEHAKWISDENTHGLILGNVKFKDAKDKTVTLCEAYPTIELTFQAEGVAVAGETPKIILRTPCSSEVDSPFLNTITLPWKRIKSLKPNEKNYKEGSITLFFRSLDEFWPLEWSLFEIKLYPSDVKNPFITTGYDVAAIRNEPLNFFLLPRKSWR